MYRSIDDGGSAVQPKRGDDAKAKEMERNCALAEEQERHPPIQSIGKDGRGLLRAKERR